MDMDRDNYLAMDEREDVIEFLAELASALRRARNHPRAWKWAIIAAHGARQGALVVTLSGTAGVGALSERSARKVLEWINASREDRGAAWPDEFLAPLEDLLERSQNADRMRELGGRPLVLSSEEKEDLKRLIEFRNEFMHYKRHTWYLQTAGLPRIVGVAARITQLLSRSHPTWTVFQEPAEAAALDRYFQEVSRAQRALGGPHLPPLHMDQRLSE